VKTRLQQWRKPENRKASLALAIAIHAVAIVAFATMSFHYELASLLGLTSQPQVDKVTYLAPRKPLPLAQAPGPRDKDNPVPGNAIRLVAPVRIPSTLPPLPKPSAAGVTAATIGSGTGSRNPLTVGVVPAQPDDRIILDANQYGFPKSTEQRRDSAIKQMFADWRDSVIAADLAKGKDPRDWTIDRDGKKWGWDPEGIHLGKFMIPNALLAALPLNIGGGVDPQRWKDQREADYIRQDILAHQGAMSDEDFKSAVKRIRERVDKEKKEKDADKTKAFATDKSGVNP
jgi:hypothetical protein